MLTRPLIFSLTLAITLAISSTPLLAKTLTAAEKQLVGTWQGRIHDELLYQITFRRNHTWIMRPVDVPDARPQSGGWELVRDTLVIRTDGRKDVIGHRVTSLGARKATFNPVHPFTLTRVR